MAAIATAYAPNRYHRVHMHPLSLIYAHTKSLVGASLKGVPLHCIIFRTATELACGYGGSVGAMKAMGGSNMSDAELKQTVTDWREASPHIVQLWRDVEAAAMKAVRQKTSAETHGIIFSYESGFLFVHLPGGRRLAYVKPRIGENRFGGESITYWGVGTSKRWERL